MAEVHYKRGDTSPALRVRVWDEDGHSPGVPSIVTFVMRLPNAAGPKVERNAQIADSADDELTVEHQWQTTDLDTVGSYRAEFRLEYTDGSVLTAPNDGYITVHVRERLGA